MFVNRHLFIIACIIYVGESGIVPKDVFLNFVVLAMHLIVHTEACCPWTKCAGNKWGYVENGATTQTQIVLYFFKSTFWLFSDSKPRIYVSNFTYCAYPQWFVSYRN